MTQKLIVLFAGLALAAPLSAQESQGPVADILQAILLPRTTAEARQEGIPEEEVQTALKTAWGEGIPASETQGVFSQTVESVRENGPIENFGAFVQSQLAAGLRGRDLAAAIHAEHARRGIGKGLKLKSKKVKGMPKADAMEEKAEEVGGGFSKPFEAAPDATADAEEQADEKGKAKKGDDPKGKKKKTGGAED